MIYIKTEMFKMPKETDDCQYVIIKPRSEWKYKCGCAFLGDEIFDCCKENCPLITQKEIADKAKENENE